MKKLTKKALRVMLVLGLIVCGSVALSASPQSEWEEGGDYSQDINESFTANIDEIEITILNYSIFIETHDSDEILVKANIENSKYENPLIVEISGDSLEISKIKRMDATSNKNLGSGTIVIKVPNTSKYDYDIDLSFADMEMHAMAKDVWINSAFTNIELFSPVERLDANSSFGYIKATADSSSSSFSFNSSFGDVRISLLDDIGGVLKNRSTSKNT